MLDEATQEMKRLTEKQVQAHQGEEWRLIVEYSNEVSDATLKWANVFLGFFYPLKICQHLRKSCKEKERGEITEQYKVLQGYSQKSKM